MIHVHSSDVAAGVIHSRNMKDAVQESVHVCKTTSLIHWLDTYAFQLWLNPLWCVPAGDPKHHTA